MRSMRLVFAVLAYLLFFLSFCYLIGFVGDLAVPKSIDRGDSASPAVAVIVDLALIALFGVQHSAMARPGTKAAMARWVHPAIERSVYVVATVAVLVALFVSWRPIPMVVWTAGGAAAAVLWGLFALGWGLVFVSTWLLNHFELFGLSQAWLDFRGVRAGPAVFREPLFYRYVRHPLWLPVRLLGDPGDDGGASAVRGGDDRVHPDRHPLRGARPHRAAGRPLSRLSHAGGDADPGFGEDAGLDFVPIPRQGEDERGQRVTRVTWPILRPGRASFLP